MQIRQLIYAIKSDLKYHGGIGFPMVFLVYYTNASFRLLLNYRIGKYFYEHRWRFVHVLARFYKYKQITRRGCQISFAAKIGQCIKFPHPIGIVIGDNVIIEDNVSIWQQVTLGSHGKANKELNYPIIRSGVKIYAGAKIIGGVEIGNDAIIGANAVVNKNVPNGCIGAGVPVKIFSNE